MNAVCSAASSQADVASAISPKTGRSLVVIGLSRTNAVGIRPRNLIAWSRHFIKFASVGRHLHGLGGQLISIVALSERGQGGATITDAARAALRDLRLVIDSMDDIGGDLMLALGSWRERAAMQLRPHAIALDWRVAMPQGLPLHPELRPWHVIQIVRILDEAVTQRRQARIGPQHRPQHRDARRRPGTVWRDQRRGRRQGLCTGLQRRSRGREPDDAGAAQYEKSRRALRGFARSELG